MLAYVFWHTRSPESSGDSYVAKLADFHRELNRVGLPGFHGSVVFRTGGVPWLTSPCETYEEWYLLDGSAGLDVLNWAAVAPPCGEPHDAVARLAAAGTAGLYRHRAGAERPPGVRRACWTSKPPGFTYQSFYSALRPVVEKGATLWGRQMVLGPTPEFCLQAPEAVVLPAGFEGHEVALEPVWPA